MTIGYPHTVRDGSPPSGGQSSNHQLIPGAEVVRVSRGRTATIQCHVPQYSDTSPNLTVICFI